MWAWCGQGFSADIFDGVEDLISSFDTDDAVPEIEAEDRPFRAAGGGKDRRRDTPAVRGARPDREIASDDLDAPPGRVDAVSLARSGELAVPDPAGDPAVDRVIGALLVHFQRVDLFDPDRERKPARGKALDGFGVGQQGLAEQFPDRLVRETVGVRAV